MHALKVVEGGNDNETLITQHSQFSIPINIVNIYGEQESRTPNEKIQEKWTNILHKIYKIEAKSEHVLIIGDLNKHVGSLVEGNEKDTDHYSILLTFKKIPLHSRKAIGGRKVIRWNTNKEGGWEMYKELTKDNAVLKKVSKEVCDDANKLMVTIDKELDSIRFKSFGKTKEKSKLKISKELESLQREKVKLCDSNDNFNSDIKDKLAEIDGKIAASLLKKQREVFETELKELKDLKTTKGKAAAIFKTKNKIVGSKTIDSEAVVVFDPITKTEVYRPDDIMRVSLEYCCKLLTNRNPKNEFVQDIAMKRLVHDVRMNYTIDDDDELEELTCLTSAK